MTDAAERLLLVQHLRITRTRSFSPPAGMEEPLRCSIPLPRGTVGSSTPCVLTTEDARSVPVQRTVLASWPDGSVKWALLDFALPALSTDDSCRVSFPLSDGAAAPPLATARDGRVEMRSHHAGLILERSGSMTVQCDGRQLGEFRIELTGRGGTRSSFAVTDVQIEANGPCRATALVQGTVRADDAALALTLRFTTYSSSPQIRCDVTLHNPRRARHEGNLWELGDAGSVHFKRLVITLHTHSDEGTAYFAETPGTWESLPAPLVIYQESSGGANWNSPVHVDASGSVPMTRRGFVMTTGGHERTGDRASPGVQVMEGEESWAATLLNFWEEFPSSLTITSAFDIEIEPFPAAFPALHELQGGERKTRSCVFAHGSPAAARAAVELALTPSVVYVSDAQHSDALPFIDAAQDGRHGRLLDMCIEGEHSFAAKAERMDEYGWRNFGDLVADHESAYLPADRQYVSHYNNQYDAVFGFGWQYLRTGDARWWHLMDRLARHVADIDIYHTDEDKAAYNGGMFWHTYHYVDAGKSSHRSYPRVEGVAGGGPAAEQNYNAGLALHYLLTGWVPSRDAAIRLGQWVIDMDDGAKTPFRWLAGGSTGLASASGIESYHGPGRAGGNSINALLVAFELSGDRRYLQKAEELIHRCVHPRDDLAALNLLDAERRWYYTVFLEAVGRYLWCKWQLREIDAAYDYARRSLLHYAEWMSVHEYPYLEKPEILEYPTETWSAQDIRKSEVLAWAALCQTGDAREEFLRASGRFHDDVLTRLPAMPTWGFTRPLVLMLARGYGLPWVQAHADVQLPSSTDPAVDPPPRRFVPQKAMAKRRLTLLAAAFTAAASAGLVALLLL